MCSVAKPAVEVLSADTQQVVLKPRIPRIPFYFLFFEVHSRYDMSLLSVIFQVFPHAKL